ncbi:hypothetical protein IQ07DRAFT_648266 [Pyrenochaeta sp. DS3sAY3a]|nr:hypothetical protein IQ07DRAFT_648266 [Pyrenochaeta sp. DS3sAY3a]
MTSPKSKSTSSTSTSTNRHTYPLHLSAGHRASTRPRAVRDLNQLIDEHLAWQVHSERVRPASAGTMIVDWDGTGAPAVSWREAEESDGRAESRKDSFMTASVGEADKMKASGFEEARERRRRDRAGQGDASQRHLRPRPQDLYADETGLWATYHSGNLQPSSASASVPSLSLSTTPAQRHVRTHNHTAHNHTAPHIAGYDPSTAFEYDYNGRIMHIHRAARVSRAQKPTQHTNPATNTTATATTHTHSLLHTPIPGSTAPALPSPALSASSLATQSTLSAHSAYYAIDAGAYSADTTLHIEDEGITALPAAERAKGVRRAEKVVRFVGRLLGVLEGCGWLGRLREGMKGREAKGRKEGGRQEGEAEVESWVRAGYIT